MADLLESNASANALLPAVCVPSGNLGNVTAGVMAHLSGMPVSGFLAAHNSNDFLMRHLRDGSAMPADTIQTLSNAMDVGAPSNFERLQSLLPEQRMSELIAAESATDQQTVSIMRSVYEQTGYVADPHTSVGIHAVRQARKTGRFTDPVIVMSTAHPAKFPDTCHEAVGFRPDEPSRLSCLADAAKEWTDMDVDIRSLADAVRACTGQ